MKSKVTESSKNSKKAVSKLRYYASLLEAMILFIIAVFATHAASKYAHIKASNHVEDIILSNTDVHNFEFLFVHGAIILTFFVVALCFRFTKTAPFVIKTVSFFILVRAVFVSLTHIGPYPSKLELESGLLDFITSGNDLFFSGHTGLPFLIALIFWDHKYIRYLFLLASVVFGVIVLLSHLHYSIDVFAAFFITYSIYHIALKFFHLDYSFFELGESEYFKDKKQD
jgi:membrane-associated phospholipid phosphatase